MYTSTRNDLNTFLMMDAFWKPEMSLTGLTAALDADNWQVQQAALAAIGDRGEAAALDAIEALLAAQDNLPVYDCPDEWNLDAATNTAERETWRCRFRVKQAAIIAICKCVGQHGPEIVSEALFQRIQSYAVSRQDDYAVRAAACDLLGKLARVAARTTLEQAATDGEWCTAVIAQKALLSRGLTKT